MTALSDIRERDAEPVHAHDYMTHAHVDRRYLLSLIDAYQAREREARFIIGGVASAKGVTADDNRKWCRDWNERRTAWLAAPPVEGEGERASTQAVCAGERSAGH